MKWRLVVSVDSRARVAMLSIQVALGFDGTLSAAEHWTNSIGDGPSKADMAKYSYHRLDTNHREIKTALEAVGATVNEKGPLDLLVGFRGANYLLEVKTARGHLRASQKAFLAAWRGQSAVVRTVNEALHAIGARSTRDFIARVVTP